MPGLYWFESVREHVSYESRLEMRILQQLDFEGGVGAVRAQPFEVTYEGAGRSRRHVPDFIVMQRSQPALVIDVKPAAFVQKPENKRAFEATAVLCRQCGWDYRVRTEPDPAFGANVDWLSGFRKAPAQLGEYAEAILGAAANPATVDGILGRFGPWGALARPVLFHLLWRRMLSADLSSPLLGTSPVWLRKVDA